MARIQACARTWFQQRARVRNQRAATRIQAAVRGMLLRGHARLRVLQARLAYVHRMRHKEMLLVELNTLEQKEEYRHKIIEKTKRRDKQLGELIDSRNKIVEYLRQENRKIRDQNNKFEAVIFRLGQMNEQVQYSTEVHNANFQIMRKTVKVLTQRSRKLMEKEDRHKKRVDKQVANLAATRARSMHETRIRKTYEAALGNIVDCFENQSKDEGLVDMVVAMSNGECEEYNYQHQKASDDEQEEGFLLTWCIDDEASINSDITSVHGHRSVIGDDDSFEEEVVDDDCSQEVGIEITRFDDDDGTCQSSVWIETHSILL
jgi:peptide methionine sulfoxide reductase MsrA